MGISLSKYTILSFNEVDINENFRHGKKWWQKNSKTSAYLFGSDNNFAKRGGKRLEGEFKPNDKVGCALIPIMS